METARLVCEVMAHGESSVFGVSVVYRVQFVVQSDSSWKARSAVSLLHTVWVQQLDTGRAAQCCQSVLHGVGEVLSIA